MKVIGGTWRPGAASGGNTAVRKDDAMLKMTSGLISAISLPD